MATLTASAKSVTHAGSGLHVRENFEEVLVAGLDEVFKREMAVPEQGMQFFRKRGMDKATIKFQSHYGLGPVSQNRDADTIPMDEKGLGFGWELTSNMYRGGIAIERNLKEDELYGTINDLQSELVASLKLSREMVCADMFNRCLGASGAPVLADDGMYFIDSARPRAYKGAAAWSNLESSSAITADSIYTAQLNIAATVNERGYLSPLRLKKLIIRPTDEKTVWEILKSDLRPADAMNAGNFQKGRFEYMVYDHLTSAVILYFAGDSFGDSKNELIFGERTAPQLETWTDGNNPDISRQRIRARFGIGLGSPVLWRGGTVT
jgi:hypothetical protein